jgi:hypothetical protein
MGEDPALEMLQVRGNDAFRETPDLYLKR